MQEGLDFDQLLMIPQRSTVMSRKDVKLERTFQFYHSLKTWTGIPIIASNMGCTGIESVASIFSKYKMITALHKYHTVDETVSILTKYGLDYVWPSIGLKDFDKIVSIHNLLVQKTPLQFGSCYPNIVIDVPSGYISGFVEYCKKIRNKFPNSIICAGNIVTLELCQELILHGGVDICKIGIGSGKNCKTRLMTGVGVPQATAIKLCSHIHGLKSDEKRLGLLCSDGGIQNPGDIAKAFGLNADFTMIGGLIAGTSETGTKEDWEYQKSPVAIQGQEVKYIIDYTKPLYLKNYGMSSHYSQEKHAEGRKNYRASEGHVIKVPHKGPLDDLTQEILGGLRSCGAYLGAKSLKEFSRCARFIKVNKIHDNMNHEEHNENTLS